MYIYIYSTFIHFNSSVYYYLFSFFPKNTRRTESTSRKIRYVGLGGEEGIRPRVLRHWFCNFPNSPDYGRILWRAHRGRWRTSRAGRYSWRAIGTRSVMRTERPRRSGKKCTPVLTSARCSGQRNYYRQEKQRAKKKKPEQRGRHKIINVGRRLFFRASASVM